MKTLSMILSLVSVSFFAQSGNVGINTTSPQTNLHVKGTLRLENSSKSNGAVLRVYDEGSMKWKSLFVSQPIRGEKTISAGVQTSTTAKYTGMRITLPTGRWIVKLNLLIPDVSMSANQGLWVDCYLSNSDTAGTLSPDYVANSATHFGGSIKYPASFGMIVGGVVINNTTSTPKTYYLWAQHEAFPNTATSLYSGSLAGDAWNEDKIYAIPFE